MKTIKAVDGKAVTLTAYEFSDFKVDSEGYNRIIENQIEFLIEDSQGMELEEIDPQMVKAIEHSERMQTPWFLPSYIWDYCKEDIIFDLSSNDDLYDETGSMLPLTYFMKDNKVDSIQIKVFGKLIPVVIEDAK